MNDNRWKILHIVNIGTFMSTLDVGIVNVALPTMANQFTVSLALIQWVVTSYLLTLVALLPFFGRFSDRVDRSKVYSWGFLIFSLGSLFIVIYPHFTGVIISRCIQGIGATMIMANSQAMVRQVFPNNERGKALGFNAVIISLGTLAGPSIGGVLLDYIGWPGLFIINIPLGFVAMILGLRMFPKIKKHRLQKEGLDLLGSLFLAAGSVFLMLGAVNLEREGYSRNIVIELIIGIFLLLALLFYEKKIENGIIDMELFSNRSIFIGNASGFAIHLLQNATLIPITFYLQEVMSYSTWKIGIILSLQPFLMGIMAPFSGWYRDRFGPKIPLIIGPALCAISLIFIILPGSISIQSIGWSLAIFGAGIGFFQAINNAEIMSATPDTKISLSSSLLALIRYFGMIVGTGVATAFVGKMGLSSYDGKTADHHMHSLFILCLIVGLISVGLSMLRRTEKTVIDQSIVNESN